MRKILAKLLVPSVFCLGGLINYSCASAPSAKTGQGDAWSLKKKDYSRLVADIDKTLVKHNHPDKVDLEILVDQNYIDAVNNASVVPDDTAWWKKIKYNVLTHTAKRFRDEFGIEIEIDSVKYIDFDERAEDMDYLFDKIMLNYSPGELDAVLAFVAGPPQETLGMAILEENYALVLHNSREHLTTQHEISHLFGAVDFGYSDLDWWDNAMIFKFHPMFAAGSVMTYNFSKNDKWSSANTLRIRKHKNRPWKYDSSKVDEIKKYLSGFSERDRKSVLELVCYAGSPEYSARAEALGYRLSLYFPRDWRILNYYAKILSNKPGDRKIVDIAKIYRKIIELEPPARILNNIAWDMAVVYGHLLYLGLDAEAIARKAVKMEPSDYNLDTLGSVLCLKGEYNEAKKYLEEAVKNTKKLDIVIRLAGLYHTTNDFENFTGAVRKMLEIEPEEGLIYLNYSNALMSRFKNRLNGKEKTLALDLALDGYDIYPSKIFAGLVRDAYMFNNRYWNDKDFNKKYGKRISDILGGTKK